MPEPERTLLHLEDGSRLETSARGDLYWITEPDGTHVPCPTELACQFWLLGGAAADPGEAPAGPAGSEWAGFTASQRDLLEHLGISPSDIDVLYRPGMGRTRAGR